MMFPEIGGDRLNEMPNGLSDGCRDCLQSIGCRRYGLGLVPCLLRHLDDEARAFSRIGSVRCSNLNVTGNIRRGCLLFCDSGRNGNGEVMDIADLGANLPDRICRHIGCRLYR